MLKFHGIFVVLLCFADFVASRNCADQTQASAIPKGLKAIPVMLTITALGSDVKLPCRYCDARPELGGRVWRRRDLRGNETEVSLDLHDDPGRNRVYADPDHSLVIREVRQEDAAYYFCYDQEKEAPKIDILLDVGYRTPLEPHVLKMPVDLKKEVPKLLQACDKIRRVPAVSEYECYAEWGPWSRCDVCGKVGTRRKVGECRLQKLVKAEVKTPEGKSVEADFPIVGVGCHSLLLNAVPKAKEILDKIPNIVLLENCEVSCENYGMQPTEMTAFRKSSFLKKIKVKVAKFSKQEAPAIVSEVKQENEGSSITLFCPGASLDTKVQWRVAGRPLRASRLQEKTAGRMRIDATDALHILRLQPADTGEYVCTLYDVEIGLIRLKVVSKYRAFDPTSHFGVLTLGMVLSFVVWAILMTVKSKAFAMQRRVQQRRAARTTPNQEEGAGSPLISLSQSDEES